MSNQPVWKEIAQLGDADPITYGGYFVYVDETGVYAPEVSMIEPPTDDVDEDDPDARWTVYRFVLEPCTFIDGVLSDNPYHPAHAVWFADKLADIAQTMGQDELDLLQGFTSSDPVARAYAWRCVGDYFGYHELDHYPQQLTRAEVEQRFAEV